MLNQIWQKKFIIRVDMDQNDIASEFEPLPLFIEVAFNHYIGFYYDKIKDFFFRSAPHPCSDSQFKLVYHKGGNEIILKPTDLVFNLYMRYFREEKDSPPLIIAHFRCDQSTVPKEQLDLLDFYKQSLKASTCLRNRKQGVAQLFSTFSPQQLNNLGLNYKNSNFDKFYGSQNQQLEDIGFRLLIKKWDSVPVRIYTKLQRLQRSYDRNQTINDVRDSLRLEYQCKVYFWGVEIPSETRLAEILPLCHMDGFLYFYLDM